MPSSFSFPKIQGTVIMVLIWLSLLMKNQKQPQVSEIIGISSQSAPQTAAAIILLGFTLRSGACDDIITVFLNNQLMEKTSSR